MPFFALQLRRGEGGWAVNEGGGGRGGHRREAGKQTAPEFIVKTL